MFPFVLPEDGSTLRMNARAGVARLIEVELEKYGAELRLKAEIIASDPAYYCQCPPSAEPLVWETLELLLPDMARAWPQFFTLTQDGGHWTWTNRLLGTTTRFAPGDAASLPFSPLDWLARQMQEDLILMAPNRDGELVCAGGHLCFASGWSLGEKMGQSLSSIHEVVPGFAETLGRPADLLTQRLKPGRPVARWNWTLSPTDRLNLAPALADDWTPARRQITPENAGERCRLRLEYQTLSRLPSTSGVLFTIHTFLRPVAPDAASARRLASAVRAMPPALRDYKGLTPYADALLAFLDTFSFLEASS